MFGVPLSAITRHFSGSWLTERHFFMLSVNSTCNHSMTEFFVTKWLVNRSILCIKALLHFNINSELPQFMVIFTHHVEFTDWNKFLPDASGWIKLCACESIHDIKYHCINSLQMLWSNLYIRVDSYICIAKEKTRIDTPFHSYFFY